MNYLNKLTKRAKYLALLGLLTLSGCLDISQEMWVYEDGSGRLQYQIGVHEQLMLWQTGKSNQQICHNLYQDQEKLKKHEAIQSVNYKSYKEAGIIFCVADIYVNDFTLLQKLQDDTIKGGEFESSRDDFQSEFTLNKQRDGSGFFRQHIRNQAGQAGDTQIDIHAKQLGNALFGRTMAGRYWSITLHAPRITETNGKLSEDKTSVSWRVPLYDLMLDDNYALDMQAKFDIELPWYKKMWKWMT